MCCVMGYTGHDLSAAKFKEYLLRTVMRGPDDQRVVEGPFGLMGFGRLAIMGLTPEGMQPFYRGADCVVCNGELYGFRFEKEILKRRGYKFQSDCDCEILLPLYYEYGLDMFRHMDSEFALILYDSRKDRLIAARDPIGIRPLFYGYSKSSHQIAFASEMQNLIGWCDDIRPFPIGSYYCDGRFVRYEDIADVPAPMQDDMDTVLINIREKLIAGVEMHCVYRRRYCGDQVRWGFCCKRRIHGCCKAGTQPESDRTYDCCLWNQPAGACDLGGCSAQK